MPESKVSVKQHPESSQQQLRSPVSFLLTIGSLWSPTSPCLPLQTWETPLCKAGLPSLPMEALVWSCRGYHLSLRD